MKKKSFRYYAEPDEIEAYIKGQGYLIERIVHNEELIRFDVVGTTVVLSTDVVINGNRVGYGGIGVRMSLKSEEETKRSLELYQALYKKFGKTEK